MCHFPRRGTWVPRLWEALVALAAEGPVNYRPANSSAQFPDSLSSRTQWVWGPCDNLPTRANGQRSQPTSGQTHLPKGGHPAVQHGGPELKAPPLGGHSPSISIASPARLPLSKAEGEVSMTLEVRKILSQAGLDTSEHASGSSTPKRQKPVVLVTSLPTKLEDFPKPVDTSS